MEINLVSMDDGYLFRVVCSLAKGGKKQNWFSKLHLITHYEWMADISCIAKVALYNMNVKSESMGDSYITLW